MRERQICDLKVRIAEISYAAGLPPYLADVFGELALREILPRATAGTTDGWEVVLERIRRLGEENARNWVDELLNRGVLAIVSRVSDNIAPSNHGRALDESHRQIAFE